MPDTSPTRTTKIRDALLATIGLVIAYALGSRALDTGSYWEYLFTISFFILSIRLYIRAIKHHDQRK